MISHIGFIMDGNRRFAKKNGISIQEGYRAGMLQFFTVLRWVVKHNISISTFFALSLDNAKQRESEELATIKDIVLTLLENKEFEEFCKEKSISIQLKGRYFKDNRVDIELLKEDEKKEQEVLDVYSEDCTNSFSTNSFKNSKGIKEMNITQKYERYRNEEKLLKDVEERVKNLNESLNYVNYTVNIALFYDGQEEITRACQRISQMVKKGKLQSKDITSKTIKEYSYFNSTPPPQVIVRPGNAPRISGFMLFDLAYSEMYFTPKLWPELIEKDLDDIMTWFSSLKRNFGK